jgi:hypothetical protein
MGLLEFGLWLGIQGFGIGYRVKGVEIVVLGFGVWNLGSRIQSSRFRLSFRVSVL